MGKIIAASNMTIDGFCDHTASIADEETHQHYADLLSGAGMILFGRITFELMEYWKTVVENPTGNPGTDQFAVTIDNIPKVVFSRTLKGVDWRNTELKKDIIKEEILALKEQSDADILIGSPSVIVALTQLNLIDEYQLAVHPIILGKGLPLFRNISERVDLELFKTKTFDCGVNILYLNRIEKRV